MKAVLTLALLALLPTYAGAEHESHGAGDMIIDIAYSLEQITSLWHEDKQMPFPPALERMNEPRAWQSCEIRGRSTVVSLADIRVLDRSCHVNVNPKRWMDLDLDSERWAELCRDLMEQFGVPAPAAATRCEIYHFKQTYRDSIG